MGWLPDKNPGAPEEYLAMQAISDNVTQIIEAVSSMSGPFIPAIGSF